MLTITGGDRFSRCGWRRPLTGPAGQVPQLRRRDGARVSSSAMVRARWRGRSRLLTGLLMSLGTHWRLLRHYWVIFKLVINLGALGVLLAAATVLAIYKPRGMTRYGGRRHTTTPA